MSHPNVEKAIGRLATDEGFRRRFLTDPKAALGQLVREGCELTPVELHALASIAPETIALLGHAIDGRLQKVDLDAE